MKGQTLYVQKNMTEGFFVDEDAKVVFVQTNSDKTTTELATGSDEVHHFIDDLNKKDKAKYSFVISAILENGAAKVVVINDGIDNTVGGSTVTGSTDLASVVLSNAGMAGTGLSWKLYMRSVSQETFNVALNGKDIATEYAQVSALIAGKTGYSFYIVVDGVESNIVAV